jgi:hypothetical protein
MTGNNSPHPKLKSGVINSADNSRLICVECAGLSAKFTRRDLSGQCVTAVPYAETVAWFQEFGKPMACECGKTVYLLPPTMTQRSLIHRIKSKQ